MTDEQAAEIISRLSALEAENKILKAKVEAKATLDYASGIPSEFHHNDPKISGVDSERFARRVVVETTPGLAEDYAKYLGFTQEAVVDSGVLIKNSKKNPLE